VGLITATLDNYSATVEVIPTSILEIDAEIVIPEGGFVYDGTPKEPEVRVLGEVELTENVDYSIAYLNNVNAGEASVVITSLETGKCSGSKVITFTIAAAPISLAEIDVEISGGNVSVKLTRGEEELVLDRDYELRIETNESAGMGLVTVVGIGNYTGTKTEAFALESGDIIGGETDTSDTEGTDETEPVTDETGGGTETETAGPEDTNETTPLETESDGTDETEPRGGEETTDEKGAQGDETDDVGDDDNGGWFAKNAAWVIPVGIITLGAVGAAIYFLLVKKKYVELLKLFKKKETNDAQTNDGEDEERDSK
jgi:hypothetical protein